MFKNYHEISIIVSMVDVQLMPWLDFYTMVAGNDWEMWGWLYMDVGCREQDLLTQKVVLVHIPESLVKFFSISK